MKTNRYGSFLSHMRRLSGCILILLLCLTLCGMLTEPVTVNAAARPVSITSCKLKGKSRIRVTATATNTKKIHGSRCYLFALAPGSSSLSSSARPIASARKSKKMTFSCRSTQNGTSLLYHSFAIASRNSRGNTPLSAVSVIFPIPEPLPVTATVFPKRFPKKGCRSTQICSKMLKS